MCVVGHKYPSFQKKKKKKNSQDKNKTFAMPMLMPIPMSRFPNGQKFDFRSLVTQKLQEIQKQYFEE